MASALPPAAAPPAPPPAPPEPTAVAEKRFVIGRKVGAGSFGELFIAKDLHRKEQVALKLERTDSLHPQLHYEARVIRALHSYRAPFEDASAPLIGFPQMYWFGQVTSSQVGMAMTLLGPSLEDLFNHCGRRFSLKTTLQLADQMIERIRCLHGRHFIHRDIKPDNFLLGLGAQQSTLHLIDFGLSKRYRDPRTLVHMAFRDGKSLTGTARYVSLATHLGMEQSRRDDLESIAYLLLYFLRGSLPWQGLRARDKKQKYQRIKEKKMNTPSEALCAGCPMELKLFLDYCRALGFAEPPDYDHLCSLIRSCAARHNITYDGVFDWMLLPAHESPLWPQPVNSDGFVMVPAAHDAAQAIAAYFGLPQPSSLTENASAEGNFRAFTSNADAASADRVDTVAHASAHATAGDAAASMAQGTTLEASLTVGTPVVTAASAAVVTPHVSKAQVTGGTDGTAASNGVGDGLRAPAFKGGAAGPAAHAAPVSMDTLAGVSRPSTAAASGATGGAGVITSPPGAAGAMAVVTHTTPHGDDGAGASTSALRHASATSAVAAAHPSGAAAGDRTAVSTSEPQHLNWPAALIASPTPQPQIRTLFPGQALPLMACHHATTRLQRASSASMSVASLQSVNQVPPPGLVPCTSALAAALRSQPTTEQTPSWSAQPEVIQAAQLPLPPPPPPPLPSPCNLVLPQTSLPPCLSPRNRSADALLGAQCNEAATLLPVLPHSASSAEAGSIPAAAGVARAHDGHNGLGGAGVPGLSPAAWHLHAALHTSIPGTTRVSNRLGMPADMLALASGMDAGWALHSFSALSSVGLPRAPAPYPFACLPPYAAMMGMHRMPLVSLPAPFTGSPQAERNRHFSLLPTVSVPPPAACAVAASSYARAPCAEATHCCRGAACGGEVPPSMSVLGTAGHSVAPTSVFMNSPHGVGAVVSLGMVSMLPSPHASTVHGSVKRRRVTTAETSAPSAEHSFPMRVTPLPDAHSQVTSSAGFLHLTGSSDDDAGRTKETLLPAKRRAAAPLAAAYPVPSLV